MIYARLALIAFIVCYTFYCVMCVFQLFGLIRFTEKDREIEFPKLFIPFYYFIVK